jgi:hypothetical protein
MLSFVRFLHLGGAMNTLLVVSAFASALFGSAMPARAGILPSAAHTRNAPHADSSVTGRVLDEKGEAIPGATVRVRGLSLGTVTDVDGNYRLDNVPADATLVFSYIGLATQEQKLSGRAVVDVILKEDVQKLNEVVVVGYGTQKRTDVTGSVLR